jgi:hypothetical protein
MTKAFDSAEEIARVTTNALRKEVDECAVLVKDKADWNHTRIVLEGKLASQKMILDAQTKQSIISRDRLAQVQKTLQATLKALSDCEERDRLRAETGVDYLAREKDLVARIAALEEAHPEPVSFEETGDRFEEMFREKLALEEEKEAREDHLDSCCWLPVLLIYYVNLKRKKLTYTSFFVFLN